MVEVDFDSADEAAAAYYGEDVDDDGTPPTGEAWMEPEVIDDFAGGWVLWEQGRVENPEETRYFVTRYFEDDERLEVLTIPDGQVREAELDEEVDELPHTDREERAREAIENWLAENDPEDDEEGGDEADQWGEWAVADEVGNWHIWGRDHLEEDRAQFLIAGELTDGTPVFLNENGMVDTVPTIFESAEETQAALDAYYSNLENGEIPEEEQPTGGNPDPETIAAGADEAGANDGGGVLDDVGATTIAAGAALLGIGYLAVRNGGDGDA